MFTFLNQYSYILFSLFIVTIAFFLVYRAFSIKPALLTILILVLVVVFFQNSLTSSPDELKDISAWDSLHNSGRPVLLYLYSDL
jgi:predicted benzoate:H+ symporter BenE